MKRILPLLLAIGLILLTPVIVLADESVETASDTQITTSSIDGNVLYSGACGEDVNWELYDNGTLLIKGNGQMEDFSNYEGAPWKENVSIITTIIIEDGVESIGEYAFSKCQMVTDVTIPDTVTSIGDSALYRMWSLNNIYIPSSVTNMYNPQIHNDCIVWCQAETKPSGWNVTFYWDVLYGASKSEYDFWNKELTGEETTVTIPDGCKWIPKTAFLNNTNLTGVNIPNSVTSIGDSAFYGCSALENVNISDWVASIGNSVFYGCSALENVNISDGVTSIGNNVFYGCNSLENLFIPSGVTNFGYNLFGENCKVWCKVERKPSEWGTLDGTVFYDVSKEEFEFFTTLTGTETSVVIPDGIKKIHNGAFAENSNLSSIIIPDSVTSIGDESFDQCSNLENINISDKITSIGNNAFSGCIKMKHVYISNNVTDMGDTPFYTMTNVWCQAYSRPYEWGVLSGNVIFNASKSEYDFWNNLSGEETSIEIPYGFDIVPIRAFYGNSNLSSIDIPESVTKISEEAFNNCTNLTNVTVPDNVTYMGRFAFAGCKNLTSITIPGRKSSFAYRLFDRSKISDLILTGDDFYYSEETGDCEIANVIYQINGNKTIQSDITINKCAASNTKVLLDEWGNVEIASGATLTIGEGVTFTNNGLINILGRLVNNGSIYNSKDARIAGAGENFDSIKNLSEMYSGNGTITCEVHEYSAYDDAVCNNCGSLIQTNFNDVKSSSWYYVYVNKAKELELMSGYTPSRFGPNDKMSRGQFAVIMHRIAGSPEVEYKGTFPDVPNGKYYSQPAVWCSQNKIITGYENGKFGPNDDITREQVVTIIYRYAKEYLGLDTKYDKAKMDKLSAAVLNEDSDVDLSKFADVDKVSSYAVDGFKWCVENNIITGKDNNTMLAPKDKITRAEAAAIMVRANDILKEENIIT